MKFSESSSAITKTFNQGMVKDVSDEYLQEGMWTHARNLVTNTHLGEKGHVSNEPSNFLCVDLPYTYVGSVKLSQYEWIIFSTDNTSSEIGIFNQSNCSYKKVINADCLNFKTTNLVKAVVKKNYDKSRSIYFVDGLNHDKYINLDYIPFKTTGNNLSTEAGCFIPEYTTELDCEQTLINSKVSIPKIHVKRSISAGQLINGSYQVSIAYSVNGIRMTDYFTPSNIQPLWTQQGIGGALDITFENLDDKFDEYELVIISVTNQQTVAKRLGFYSTSQSTVHVSVINEFLPTVDLTILTLSNPFYYKSDKIYKLNDYLLRAGVSTRPELNYQIQANNIVTKWVEVEYPANYYQQGGNSVGYMRGEVYSFFIRWIYDTGHKSASYHIPGRAAINDERTITAAQTVKGEKYKWESHETATRTTATGTVKDGGFIVASGTMSYWESSEKYPDKQPEIWGELCGKNIRHHKMPSNNTSPIYTNKGENIRVLGLQFENITQPLDEFGQPITDIVGYEILRGSREGNKTIVAKGIFNHMREYEIRDSDKQALYQNYPYNDLNPDKFLRRYMFQNVSVKTDHDQFPLTGFKNNYVSFHSPDTIFNKPFLGGNYMEIYTQETGNAVGKFDIPYNHPKAKLITNGAFIGAAIIGVGIGILSTLGRTTKSNTGGVSFIGKVESTFSRESGAVSVIPDLLNSVVAAPITTIASLAIIIAQAAFIASQGIQQMLDAIYAMIPLRNYALQYNSHCLYNESIDRFHRRNISDAKYIGEGIQDFDSGFVVNNLYRNKYVGVKIEGGLLPHTVVDNTRKRVKDFRSWEDPYKQFITQSSTYYGAIKVVYKNQYSQMDSITQIPTGSNWFATQPDFNTYKSDVIFGGDIYINRYTEKNPYFFFNQWLVNQPDGIEYDYRNYINGAFPRYWMTSERYDVSDIGFRNDAEAKRIVEDVRKEGGKDNGNLAKRYFNAPNDLHHLDRDGGKSGGLFSIKEAYFYLFCNGVRDFFVESEINLAYREQSQDPNNKFYDPYSYTDTKEIFRSDYIKDSTLVKYDNSLSTSKLYNNFVKWGAMLPRDYSPELYNKRFTYYQDRVIYSLQHQSGLKKDNWLTFLANNFRDFNAKISTIKEMNGSQAIILFENEEPTMFIGEDRLETANGGKIIVGDSGLFQQGFDSLVNADDQLEYGTCINERSAINTPYGLFYISQRTSKILQYTNSINDISEGIRFWLVENLPSKLLDKFPEYPYYDNPTIGIGCTSIYDPTYEKIYFTKKDYLPLSDKIIYDNGFKIRTGRTLSTTPTGASIYVPSYTNIELTDPTYFQECSWTLSYDPQTKSWVSYHDWHPDYMLPSYDNFFTIKNSQIWKHNDNKKSYCNFYGINYPFEVEFAMSSPNNISTLRSIEYYLETYKNSARDRFQLLDDNFDEAIIYNSEQISGILSLNITPKNNPVSLVNYPIIENDKIQILYSKEENKYRFNQFWDVTNDRGEFSFTQEDIWVTQPNGYIRDLNQNNIDYDKNSFERKKFRHYVNRLVLKKLISGDLNMILKIVNAKNLYSPR